MLSKEEIISERKRRLSMDTPSAEVQTGHVDRLEMVKAAARTRKLPRAIKRFALKKGSCKAGGEGKSPVSAVS